MSFSMSSLGLLLAPNYRSRAILQMLEMAGMTPAFAIRLPGQEPEWTGSSEVRCPLYAQDGVLTFRPNESIKSHLSRRGIPDAEAPVSDVNSPEFIAWVKSQPGEIYIYSGLAGCILKPDLLRKSGKRFIHAHGGDAPRYSGSTAFYYSILERGDIGATVFWMEEGLDTGDVITRLISKPHTGMEIDRLQDPLIRAEAFVRALRKMMAGEGKADTQDHTDRVTYHIIHPVLKHYALRKVGLST